MSIHINANIVNNFNTGKSFNFHKSYLQAPKAKAGDASCTNAVAGGDGLCVYLTRCYEARNITVDLYKTNYCVVEGG